MSTTLRIMLFIAVGAALGVWCYFLVTAVPVKIGQPLPIGSSFDGNEQIPVQEFKTKYEQGVALLDQLKGDVHLYRLLSDAAGWLTFILSSILTIFLGSQGKIFSGGNHPENAIKLLHAKAGKNKTLYTRMMIAAAACSVLVAFNGICRLKLETSLKNAEGLNTALYESRTKWFNAKDAAAANSTLEDLDKALINLQ